MTCIKFYAKKSQVYLEFALPPTSLSFLAYHYELSSLKIQLLCASCLIWGDHLDDLRFPASSLIQSKSQRDKVECIVKSKYNK